MRNRLLIASIQSYLDLSSGAALAPARHCREDHAPRSPGIGSPFADRGVMCPALATGIWEYLSNQAIFMQLNRGSCGSSYIKGQVGFPLWAGRGLWGGVAERGN